MLTAFPISDVGCVRTNNEDSFLVDPDIGLFALADGMGGAQAGEVASRLAVSSVREFLTQAPQRDEATLLQAIEYANQCLLSAASDPALRGMGTTLVCILETAEGLILANIGDSRAWALEGSSLRLLTSDQTWVNEVGRPLGISEDALRTHPRRHQLTMALGVEPPIRVQIGPLPAPPGCVLLLSSDGLHGPVNEEMIREILLRPISLEDRGHLLVEAARQAGGPDNITVVLIQN